MNKAKKLHEFLKENKHEDMTVEVDGNISSIKAQELKNMAHQYMLQVRQPYSKGMLMIFQIILEN